MALLINEECISCGACEPDCPNEAITAGEEIYEIAAAKCTECVPVFNEPQCVAVCPTDACVPDPDHKESHIELEVKYKGIHG
ncbi:MAG: YfhL family 4Fe-4S dicluster ferredoxin [Candidatus Aminicenantaceae bacterium]